MRLSANFYRANNVVVRICGVGMHFYGSAFVFVWGWVYTHFLKGHFGNIYPYF